MEPHNIGILSASIATCCVESLFRFAYIPAISCHAFFCFFDILSHHVARSPTLYRRTIPFDTYTRPPMYAQPVR